MAGWLPTPKRVVTILVVALLVTTAGCSGFLGGDPATNTTTTTTIPTTVEPTTTTSPDTTTDTTTTVEGDDDREVAATGEMAVVIDDTRLDLLEAADTNGSTPFWFESTTNSGEWHRTDTSVTVAEALETVGVTATNDSVTYNGATYTAGSNTSLAIRVDGEPVNPTEYELESGDEVWVVAITHPLNQSVPGDHIDHDSLHVHGEINMTVAGDSIDFTRDRYQTPGHNAYFHFEGGDPHWHAHSWSVSLAYAMNTLAGINVTDDSVTYNGTTYHRSDVGTSITITVNGDPVDPSTYILKDGDRINITVTTSDANAVPPLATTDYTTH